MPVQPPKKRSAQTASSSGPKKARQSKLAKENNISGEEENEIKEVFNIFSEANEEFPDEKDGVVAREDVRKALVALGLTPSSSEELQSILSAADPTFTGYVPYAPFLSVAAAKLRSRSDDAMSAEVDSAFQLFTRGTDGPITMGHLRRIARELKEDLDDALLRDMILEANGGAGVDVGVSLEQFHEIMQRAGVF
ncbi:hypothetical protein BDW60DRAFT_216986 [Aspergillus nidulans var. acristatus]